MTGIGGRRVVVVHRPGGHERLVVEEHPLVEPGPGEVAIAVEAAGVNFADIIVRLGLYASAREYVGWPITPGFEVAGVVRAVGEGVADPAVGAPVVGVTRFGGYASDVVVPRHQVFDRPPGLGAVEAASVPAVFTTADYALHQLARPRSGATALVHSAAGGVGGALLQLGRLDGLRLIGVVGAPHKVDAARAFGADHVIDRSTEDLWPAVRRLAPEGVDAVFDANGVATLRQSYRHLAPEGRLVVYGFHTMLRWRRGRPSRLGLALAWLRTPRFDPLDMTTRNRSVMAFNLSFLFHRRDLLAEAMGRILDHLAAGRLAPPPTTTYPLDDVGAAHADLEGGRTIGKLVLVP